MADCNPFTAEEKHLVCNGVWPLLVWLRGPLCFKFLNVHVWEQVATFAWMLTIATGSLTWSIETIRHAKGNSGSDKYCHFQDGTHATKLHLHLMAAAFAHVCAGTIEATFTVFCS